MGHLGYLRKVQAAARKQERESQRRKREIQRLAKVLEKLSQQEKAKLEVEEYDNSLEILLTVHREAPQSCDWVALASALPPYPPSAESHHQFVEEMRDVITDSRDGPGRAEARSHATREDTRIREESSSRYREACESWADLRSLGHGVLSGDPKSLLAALKEFEVAQELIEQGCSVEYAVHSASLIECKLRVRGIHAIPSQEKRLTATGKVTSKAIPRARFHELYQDYVCGCVLRIGRDLLSLLPIDAALVNVDVEAIDTASGKQEASPVLSVVLRRDHIESLDFSRLDPSDAVEALEHRGDFKATRKSGAFMPIAPMSGQELIGSKELGQGSIEALVAESVRMRERLEHLRPTGIEAPEASS